MAELTYYFNAYVTPVWTDPDNLVDGDTGTFGYTSAKKTAQTLTGNTCPGDDLGTITKVELRLFGKGDGDDRIDITPIFTGGNGDTHPTTPVVSPGAWTGYVDITSDTNAPDWSLWSHIQDLDCIIDSVAIAKGNTLYCSKVEIRVTYLPPLPSYDFDIGSPAIDRPTSTAYGRTLVNKNNPANASGILHTIEIYVASVSMTGLRVGTFYTTNGSTLKCRDSAVIGDATAGLNRFTELSLTVEAGDYIGCYFASGFIEETASGYDGAWWIAAEYIDPNDEAEYTFQDGWAISLYGYGDLPPPDIDVGADPTDRPSAAGSGFTRVGKDNPANASGILHSVRVWADGNITGLIVGTFYLTNGNTLKCRDSVLIGDVVAGAVRTITVDSESNPLSIAVVEGDYIGCYFTGGYLEYDTSGFAGIWYISGEYIDPNDEATYGFLAGDAFSVYGYGDIPAVAVPRHGFVNFQDPGIV